MEIFFTVSLNLAQQINVQSSRLDSLPRSNRLEIIQPDPVDLTNPKITQTIVKIWFDFF
jgi:hypothetical protein